MERFPSVLALIYIYLRPNYFASVNMEADESVIFPSLRIFSLNSRCFSLLVHSKVNNCFQGFQVFEQL